MPRKKQTYLLVVYSILAKRFYVKRKVAKIKLIVGGVGKVHGLRSLGIGKVHRLPFTHFVAFFKEGLQYVFFS